MFVMKKSSPSGNKNLSFLVFLISLDGTNYQYSIIFPVVSIRAVLDGSMFARIIIVFSL